MPRGCRSSPSTRRSQRRPAAGRPATAAWPARSTRRSSAPACAPARELDERGRRRRLVSPPGAAASSSLTFRGRELERQLHRLHRPPGLRRRARGSPSELIDRLRRRRGRPGRDHLQRLHLAAHPGRHARDAAAALSRRRCSARRQDASEAAGAQDERSEPRRARARRVRARPGGDPQRLVPDYVEISIYRALLESTAAEHGARMTAMRNASENAGETDQGLTLRDEPRPPGRDHPGDHGGRRRRRGPRLRHDTRANADCNRQEENQTWTPAQHTEPSARRRQSARATSGGSRRSRAS